VGFFVAINYLLYYQRRCIMGKKRRKLMSPKFASKCSSLRASVARLKGLTPEPTPVVEEVIVPEPVAAPEPVAVVEEKVVTIAVPEPAEAPIVVEPEPVVVEPEPAPKVTKKATTRRRTTKKATTKRTTTKRAKRTTVKKD
jgi:hypothetical protein